MGQAAGARCSVSGCRRRTRRSGVKLRRASFLRDLSGPWCADRCHEYLEGVEQAEFLKDLFGPGSFFPKRVSQATGPTGTLRGSSHSAVSAVGKCRPQPGWPRLLGPGLERVLLSPPGGLSSSEHLAPFLLQPRAQAPSSPRALPLRLPVRGGVEAGVRKHPRRCVLAGLPPPSVSPSAGTRAARTAAPPGLL